jgi:polysaccharide pyruvyl transferase WcaK-like protein
VSLRIAQARGGAVSMRDSASREIMLANGIDVGVVPDLAFLLPLAEPQSKSTLVISIRSILATYRPRLLQHLGIVVELARSLELTPLVTWQVSSDSECCEWLASALGVDLLSPPAPGVGRFEQACAIYDDAAMVVSNRLHVLLIAASRGAKPISVLHPGERKIRAIMADNGLAHQNIEIGLSDHRQIERVVASKWESETYGELAVANVRKLTAYFDNTLGSCLPE